MVLNRYPERTRHKKAPHFGGRNGHSHEDHQQHRVPRPRLRPPLRQRLRHGGPPRHPGGRRDLRHDPRWCLQGRSGFLHRLPRPLRRQGRAVPRAAGLQGRTDPLPRLSRPLRRSGQVPRPAQGGRRHAPGRVQHRRGLRRQGPNLGLRRWRRLRPAHEPLPRGRGLRRGPGLHPGGGLEVQVLLQPAPAGQRLPGRRVLQGDRQRHLGVRCQVGGAGRLPLPEERLHLPRPGLPRPRWSLGPNLGAAAEL